MPEITGFIQDPLEPITRLRNDLGDRYKQGFPVLKELIQNADDAKASHVVFGVAPGIPRAAHPLLEGRGLFIINNGVFEAKHERGIRLYGTSNKVADTAAVGKFGLGMKSVFHLCEAFFFLADLCDQGTRAGIVNPWSVPEHLSHLFQPVHPDWGPLTKADADLIRAALTPVTAGLPTPFSKAPFILWLPLRRNAHRWEDGVETGVIVSEFPGDNDHYLDFLSDSSLQTQLADLLPLLRHVQQIRFHPRDKYPESALCAEVRDGAGRLRFAEEIPENRLLGEIRVRRTETDIDEVRFSGLESYRWTRALRALSEGPHWPQNNRIDEQGLMIVEPDKAQPHAAVVLTKTPTLPGSGRLTLRWAVFLPLDESLVSETLDCGGEQDYCFTLHGYFFVDAGRRGIHGFDVLGKGRTDKAVDSVDAVRIGWNQALATNGTLPLLLPVLQEHVTDLRVAEKVDTGRRLAACILSSTLWKGFGHEITATGQWVLELTPGGSSWQLIDPNRELLPLPPPPEHDPKRPWQVFPILARLQPAPALVVARTPQLSPRPALSPDDAQIEKLLNSVSVAEAMGKQTHIAYIAATLKLCTEQAIHQPRVQIHLCRLLREGIRQVHLRGIRANRTEFRHLSALLPPGGYLTLPESLPEDLMEQLACCDLEPLLLPSDLSPGNEQPNAKLSVAEAGRLLRLIADWIRAESSRGRNKLVLDQVPRLVRLVDDASRAVLLRSVREQNLIYAYDGNADDWRAVSPETVDKARSANLVFRMGQVGDEQGLGLAKKLQAALAGGRVLVLRRETREILDLSEGQVPVCDAKGVLQALGSQPQSLKEPTSRQDLVSV